MPVLFLGHLSYLEINGSHVIFCKSTTEDKIYTFFELKWLIYVEMLSPFSLFPLYASNNLVHILLQLGTSHAPYTNHKNNLAPRAFSSTIFKMADRREKTLGKAGSRGTKSPEILEIFVT